MRMDSSAHTCIHHTKRSHSSRDIPCCYQLLWASSFALTPPSTAASDLTAPNSNNTKQRKDTNTFGDQPVGYSDSQRYNLTHYNPHSQKPLSPKRWTSLSSAPSTHDNDLTSQAHECFPLAPRNNPLPHPSLRTPRRHKPVHVQH